MTEPAGPSSIAFAWLYTAWGGAEVHLLHLARYAPAGTQVTVIAPRSTDRTLRALWSGLPHTWIDVEHTIDVQRIDAEHPGSTSRMRVAWVRARIDRGLETFRAGRAFRRAASNLDSDVVVHVDMPPWSAFLALAATARTRPVVLGWHTPLTLDRGPRSMIIRTKLALLGRIRRFHIMAASDTAQHDAARWFRRRIADIPVVPAGFDPGEIGAVPRSDPIDDLIVGVGTLTVRKGVDVAIEAVGCLHKRGRKVRLIWLGDGEERSSLEDLIRRRGLSDSVELRAADHSPTHRVDMLRTVASATVYVQPSRLDGLPVAIIEAMTLARPVIATQVGALSELGDHAGITWTAIDDLDQFVDTLDRLLQDPARRDLLGTQGREFVGGRFDMQQVASAAYAYYAVVARDSRRRR